MAIIRGTTPTLRFAFTDINADHIVTAYLVIKYDQTTLIEKPISDVVNRTETTMDWKLSQSETLLLPDRKTVDICCDWKLQDGTRGRSTVCSVIVESSGKNEVI